MASLLTVAMCAVLALTAHTALGALAAAVVLMQLVLAGAGFARPVPSPSTAMVVVAVGSVGATALSLFPHALESAGRSGITSTTLSDGTLDGIAPGVAAILLGGLLREMLRRDGRAGLVASLTAVVSVGVMAVLMSTWVAQRQSFEGAGVILVAASGLAISALCWSLPGPRPVAMAACLVLGGVAGGLVCVVASATPDWTFGLALGFTAGLLTIAARTAAEAWTPDVSARIGLEALLPLAMMAPPAYILARVFVF
ncbi:MAG: hypothetical protein ACRDP1_10460 [Nocardioidaceae bacterium]